MEEIKVFKITDTETGLFSTGGCTPNWTKRGKTWNQINHVKSHLRQFIKDGGYLPGTNIYDQLYWDNRIPNSWMVVEMSSVSGVKQYPAEDLYPQFRPEK